MKYGCLSWKSVASWFSQRYRTNSHMRLGFVTFCIGVCKSCGRPGRYPTLPSFPSFVVMPVSYPDRQRCQSPSLGGGSPEIWTFIARTTNLHHSFMDYSARDTSNDVLPSKCPIGDFQAGSTELHTYRIPPRRLLSMSSNRALNLLSHRFIFSTQRSS